MRNAINAIIVNSRQALPQDQKESRVVCRRLSDMKWAVMI